MPFRRSLARTRRFPAPPVLSALALACAAFAGGCGFFGYRPLAGTDANVELDAGTDAGMDAGTDAGQDAGQDAGVDCSTGACRYVFVTSAGLSAASVGSLLGADNFCQAAGLGAGLPGTYKAWISDSSTTAAARLAHASVPYVLRDGTRVADDWTDLVDGTLSHAIDMTEAGDVQATPVEVWTASTAAGDYSGVSCADWTNATSSMPFGGVGVSDSTTQWAHVWDQFCDRPGLRLYCFQQ